MPDLGPHAAFILAAYAATFAAVGALAFFIVDDDRRQRRLIEALERSGVRRRSAPGEAPGAERGRKNKP
jgi:heme exporter protein D